MTNSTFAERLEAVIARLDHYPEQQSALRSIAAEVAAQLDEALLLQVARIERDAVSQALRDARAELEAMKAARVDANRLVSVAVEEFGLSVERYQAMLGEKTAEVDRLCRQRQVEDSSLRDVIAELERVQAELRRYTELPLDSPYRAADAKTRLDALYAENETLARKAVDAVAVRDQKIVEASRLAERWTQMGMRLAGMRRATFALAREVGVLRQKIAQDPNFHGLFLGDVDNAIAEALKASQNASENGS